MRKSLISAAISGLLFVGAMGQAMAATTYFSEDFSDLNAWTKKSPSFASVSGNVLSFSKANSGGDIFTTAAFTNAVINFDYRGMAGVNGGGYVGISQGFPGSHTWLAGSSTIYGTAVNLVNDGTWHHYSISFSGTGHVMLEQYATNIAGAGQFRALSVTNVPVAAVPEPETYAMLLAGLGLMGSVARRRRK